MLGLGFVAPQVEAHKPTGIAAAWVTTNQVMLVWTHVGSVAGAVNADVDICRYSTTAGDRPQTIDTIIQNNASRNGAGAGNVGKSGALAQAGESAYVDHSLAEGTHYAYVIMHANPSDIKCQQTPTAQKAFKAADVHVFTKAMNPIDVSLSSTTDTIDVKWNGKFVHNGTSTDGADPAQTNNVGSIYNHTAVAGLKIEYSSDGGTTFTTATSNSTANAGVVDYTITGLESSTEYHIRVSGVTDSVGSFGNATHGHGYVSDMELGSAHVCQNCIITTRGDEPGREAVPAVVQSYSTGKITNGNLAVTLKEDRGWDRILDVALYTNINTNTQGIENSDTYITWNYFDGVTVTDPHGYFNSVDVSSEQSGVRTQDFMYNIAWNKGLANNDVILEMKDFQSNPSTTIIENAWTTFPTKQVSQVIPEETSVVEETVAMLWDGGMMNHALLNNNVTYALTDMQYFVNDEVIDVSQDEIVLEEEKGVMELFEDVTLTQKSIKIGNKYLKTLVVSGTLNTEVFSLGNGVTFGIISPDGSASKINAVTTSERTFEVPIVLEGLEAGTYQLQPIHDTHTGETILFKHQ